MSTDSRNDLDFLSRAVENVKSDSANVTSSANRCRSADRPIK